MRKKLLSLALALVMTLTLLPAAAFAEEGTQTTTPDENATTTTQDGSEENPFIITSDNETSGITFSEAGHYQLSADISVPHVWGAKDFKGSVILDLAGHTLTLTNNDYGLIYADEDLTSLEIVSSEGTGTIKPSTTKFATIQISGTNNVVTIGENVILDGTNVQDRDCFAILIAKEANGTQLNLNGCTIKDANGLTINGNNTTGNTKVQLNGATIEATGHGIYQAGNGATTDVTANDSTIKGGATGIEVRAGSLKLVNSTVIGGDEDCTVAPNGNGTTTDNAALAVAQHTTKQPINVTLEGNVTLTANAALSIKNPESAPAKDIVKVNVNGGIFNGAIAVDDTGESATVADGTLTITGGTFDADVSKYVPQDTHRCKATGDKYVVSPFVAGHNVIFSVSTGVNVEVLSNATAVTGTPLKYAVTEGDKAVTFKLTAPDKTAIDSVKLGETALTAVNGVYTIPANQISDVTVTVTVKSTVQDAPKLTVTLPNEAESTSIETALKKKVAVLQKDITVTGLTVTGTSNYVQEFTGFNATDKTEQQGNYIALKLNAVDKDGTAINDATIKVKSNNGVNGYKTLDADHLLVHRISVDTATGMINPIHVLVNDTSYDIVLTGLTLGLPPMPAPEPPTSGNTTVTNDLTTEANKVKVEEDIKNTIANVSTGKVDDKAENTPDAEGTDVTITFSGKVEGAIDGGTVKLDKTAVAALKNDPVNGDGVQGVTVNAKVETNVADVELPAGALEKLDASKNVEVKVEKKEETEYTSSFNGNTEATQLINASETIADVSVKQDTSEPLANAGLTGNDVITIRIKVDASKKDTLYQVLYINTTAKKLEKMLETAVKPSGDAENGYYVVFTVGHLSPYALIDATANADALAKLDVAQGAGGKLTAVFESLTTPADKASYYGGKLTLSNLDTNKTYLVRLDTGTKVKNSAGEDVVPTACYVIKGKTTETVSCLGAANLIVFEVKDGQTIDQAVADASGVRYFEKTPGNGTPVKELVKTNG